MEIYGMIIFKTVFLYFFVILAYRIMGKKEVGQLSIVDLIVTVLLAELIAISIENHNVSIFMSVVPIIILVAMQIGLSYLSLKSGTFRKIMDGNPEIIVKNGKIKFNVMSKLRYSLDDLLAQLREKGIENLEEVNYAILENNGKLSVFQDNISYPLPLILDGEIDKDVLKEINKDEKWLYNILEKRRVQLKDIFYAFLKKDMVYIITKSSLIK